ncbi:serine/threonine protein kinase [Rhodotorula kratochvilovae]
MPTRLESPQTHPPQAGPYLHAHHGHAHAGAGGTAVGGLTPLTPISNPASPGGSGGSGSGGGPASSTLSLTSISSTSTTHTTTTGISRASSVRSTSSVQAVPMRKPQRGPAVPRIVTRGINALGAYGVGVPSSTQSPTRAVIAPLTAANVDAKGKAREDSAERPGMPGRASWRRKRGDGLGATGNSPLPSPVQEGGSASPSSPFPPPAPDNEGWRATGTRLDSPARSPRGAEGGEGWPRPRYDRADSSRRDDVVRVRNSSDATASGRDGDPRAGSLSPPQSPTAAAHPHPPPTPHARGRHEREMSGASGSTAGPASPRSPRPAASGARVDWGAVGEARPEGSAERAPLVGMSPNAMGVVGNRRSTEDFEFGEVLGEGSYSTVTHVTTVHPPYRQYALKVLDKEHIKRERKTKYVLIERDTLKALDGHPGVIKLWWTFQDEWSLYYVLEFAENGELLQWIKKYGSFDLRSARYYVAQILSAVGFMHEKGVIHRDLKPENILLDRSMRVKITDFGTAKLLKQEEIKDGQPGDDPQGRPRARSFVGTPEYVSPEILSEGRESSFSSDFWALGCVLYQMLAGRPPFQARTEYLMFQKIVKLEYEFPLGFPADAKDLVEKLLVVDPKTRLGGDPANGNGIEAVMGHPFFTSHISPRPRSPSNFQRSQSALSTPPSQSAVSSLRNEPSSTEETVSTPASSVAAPSKNAAQTTSPTPISGDNLAALASELALETSEDTPPASSTPRPPRHGPSPAPQPEEPLDAPIDWSTIWTVEPPRIHTGLTPPAPTIRGEFVLLGGGGDSSVAPSTTGTSLTGQRSWDGSAGPGTHEGAYPDEDEDGWEEGAEVDRGSLSDDDYAEPGSPTSTSGRDLPPASTFGGGKWSNVLLPSESILMCSPILQRPSGGAAAARTALLRSPRLKFNPRSLLSSSSSSNTSPGASPHNGTVPLPAPSPPINPANGLLTSGAPSPPLHGGFSPPAAPGAPLPPGWKPRTLILTDYPRLLCIKESPDKISVKSEVFLGSALRGGVRREGVSAFIAVEPRGNEGKGFTIRTSARTLKFEEPSGQASRWIVELQEAHRAGLMNSQPRR